MRCQAIRAHIGRVPVRLMCRIRAIGHAMKPGMTFSNGSKCSITEAVGIQRLAIAPADFEAMAMALNPVSMECCSPDKILTPYK